MVVGQRRLASMAFLQLQPGQPDQASSAACKRLVSACRHWTSPPPSDRSTKAKRSQPNSANRTESQQRIKLLNSGLKIQAKPSKPTTSPAQPSAHRMKMGVNTVSIRRSSERSTFRWVTPARLRRWLVREASTGSSSRRRVAGRLVVRAARPTAGEVAARGGCAGAGSG